MSIASIFATVTGPVRDLTASLPVEQPLWLLIIPFALVILAILLSFDFVKVNLDNVGRSRRRKARIWVFVSRLLISILLAVALAMPFIEISEEQAGNPQITLLIDESESMEVLDTGWLDAFRDELSERIPTTVRTIASGTDSAIGDGILDNLEPGMNILLVSDGNVVSGTSLDDVSFFAANNLNASINAIILDEQEPDASVYITGPETVVAGTSNQYVVRITSTNDDPVALTVSIDGQLVYDQSTTDRAIVFEKEFPIGEHKIEATIRGADHFADNNQFYKTVDVLEKPRVLLLTEKDSPLESILDELYTVDKMNSLPADLSPYYAIVANDVGANRLRNVQQLHNFLIDEEGGFYGGGLLVIGGFNSYDRGSYSNAPIESLLPVTVGKGEQKKGEDNIVIVVDISGGVTGVRYEKQCDAAGNCELVQVTDKASALDIIKAQAVNLISSEKNIVATNKVGVIAFGVQGTVSEEERAAGGHYEAADTVKIIEPLDYLYNNQKALKEKLPRLIGGGPSQIDLALQAAYDMLKSKAGQSNYVLLLTDGNVAPSIQQQAMVNVENLQRRGIKVFTYGVGRDATNVQGSFLTALAEAGDGLYEGPVFTTRDVNPARISIQWGDPDQKGFGDEFGLITFSLTHFITRNLELTAIMNGFNQVVPKSTATMLIRTDFGQPALTVWQYGNGRVGSLTVFTGGGLGQLLNADNSLLITRMVNWAIGDPQRKQQFYVSIDDARIGEPTTITVKSEETLFSEDIDFVKDGDHYTATFVPDRIGFDTFFGATYATNYDRELQYVGFNDALNETVSMTKGKLFSHEDVDEIIAHVSELSRRKVVRRTSFTWPFIAAAVIIFLIEIFIRRLNQYKKE